VKNGHRVRPPMADTAEDPWAPLRFLVGAWVGESTGQAGKGRGERTAEFALLDRFLIVKNRVDYAPQEKNPKGEVHEDWSLFSQDHARKTIVLREFHGEGFVNQYSLRESGSRLVLLAEAIENIPPGWRARLTLTPQGQDTFLEEFDLAGPGKDLEPYVIGRWMRAPRKN